MKLNYTDDHLLALWYHSELYDELTKESADANSVRAVLKEKTEYALTEDSEKIKVGRGTGYGALYVSVPLDDLLPINIVFRSATLYFVLSILTDATNYKLLATETRRRYDELLKEGKEVT